MTKPRDPDAIVAAWLDDGPVELPADTRRAILVGLRTQPRARRLATPGGIVMLPLSRLLAAAAVVLAVAFAAAVVLGNRSSGPGGPSATPPSSPGPSPTVAVRSASPSPSPVASSAPSRPPSPTPFPSATVFSSPLYGYAVTLPAGWLVTAAQTRWDGQGAPGFDAPNVDGWVAPHVENRCSQVFVCAPTLWAFAGPTTLDLAAWVAAQDAAMQRDHACGIPMAKTSIRIDGAAATLEDGHCGTDGPLLLIAYTVRGGTGYAFLLQDNAREAKVEDLDRSEFASLRATIRLAP